MEQSILFINACARSESRTWRLTECLLNVLERPYEEVRLSGRAFPAVDEEYLGLRDRLIAARAFDDPMFALARQFAEAETIVIAAPYWDLSFPAALKQYLELVNVVGITFRYTQEGVPVGLCRAERLFYVTTAGGCFAPEEFGFGYVRALAQSYYGIRDVRLIEALGLDLDGADVEALLRSAEEKIPGIALGAPLPGTESGR